jgi:hypothetical protein
MLIYCELLEISASLYKRVSTGHRVVDYENVMERDLCEGTVTFTGNIL